jgi:hypothetical protein
MIVSIDVGIKNLAICAVDNNIILLWKIINIGYGSDMCKTIIAEFSNFKDLIEGAVILIERQMTRKMTNIQCYIEMYFRMLNFKEVIIYNPTHKLCGTGKENSGGGLYRARKQASVEICKEWIDNNHQEEWISTLWKTTKKKDDLADTLCMIISYLKNPVFDKSNVIKIINARKPTIKQESSGNYSKSNIKYLLQKNSPDKTISVKVGKAILKFWKSIEACTDELQITHKYST